MQALLLTNGAAGISLADDIVTTCARATAPTAPPPTSPPPSATGRRSALSTHVPATAARRALLGCDPASDITALVVLQVSVQQRRSSKVNGTRLSSG
jgi:hypothetical protein